MKIFVVTANVELTHKPTWLDDFRQRYDKPYHYHITLKQPCFVDNDKIDDIKTKLKSLFSDSTLKQKIDMNFDELKVSKDAPGGICIMLNATNQQVRKLQNEVVDTLSLYKNYYKTKYEEYEKQFEPHITIARDLNDEAFTAAQKELQGNISCKAVIDKIILTVVNNFGPEEANDPKNQTTYNLNTY